MDERDARWIEAMKAKGHSPQIDERGRLEDFVYEHEHHNGPGCTVCGWCCCWHCDNTDNIPECEAIETTAVDLSAIKKIGTA